MFHVIYNPTAARGRIRKYLDRLEDLLIGRSLPFEVHGTRYAGHAAELVRELSREKADLLCLGGDGTLHEVLNGIENFDNVRLGLLPCGTGNDFAKAAGIPTNDVEKAMDIVLNQPASFVDFIALNDLRVMNVTGMGIDVEVLERAARGKILKGKMQYYKSLIVSLFKFRWNHYRIRLDDEPEAREHSAMITAVCNGNYIGGGMNISPKSDIRDGKLDVVIVNEIKRRRIPKALLGFFNGKLLSYEFVDHFRCEKVEFLTDAKPVINADGELLYNQQFRCEVVKDKLRMFLPPPKEQK